MYVDSSSPQYFTYVHIYVHIPTNYTIYCFSVNSMRVLCIILFELLKHITYKIAIMH